MIKYFCDACGKESKRLYPFKYLCHIDSKTSLNGYVESTPHGTDERVSGREDFKGVCLHCYNGIMYTAFNKFKELEKFK